MLLPQNYSVNLFYGHIQVNKKVLFSFSFHLTQYRQKVYFPFRIINLKKAVVTATAQKSSIVRTNPKALLNLFEIIGKKIIQHCQHWHMVPS